MIAYFLMHHCNIVIELLLILKYFFSLNHFQNMESLLPLTSLFKGNSKICADFQKSWLRLRIKDVVILRLLWDLHNLFIGFIIIIERILIVALVIIDDTKVKIGFGKLLGE